MKKFISICLASVLGVTTLVGGGSAILNRDTAVELMQNSGSIVKGNDTNAKFVSKQNADTQTNINLTQNNATTNDNYALNNGIANNNASNPLNYNNNCANGNCADAYGNVYQNMNNATNSVNGTYTPNTINNDINGVNNGINGTNSGNVNTYGYPTNNWRSNVNTYRDPLTTPRYSNIDTYRQNTLMNRSTTNNNTQIKSQSKTLTNQQNTNYSNSMYRTSDNQIANRQTNDLDRNSNKEIYSNNNNQIPNSTINRDKTSERDTTKHTFDSRINNENNINNSADRRIDNNSEVSKNSSQTINNTSRTNNNVPKRRVDNNNSRLFDTQNRDFARAYDNSENDFTYRHIFDADSQNQIAFLAFQIKEIANSDSSGNANIRQVSINLRNSTDEALRMIEADNFNNVTLTETQKQQLDAQANRLFEISQQLYSLNSNELSRFGFNLELDFNNTNFDRSFARIFETFEQRSNLMNQAVNCIDTITQILTDAKNANNGNRPVVIDNGNNTNTLSNNTSNNVSPINNGRNTVTPNKTTNNSANNQPHTSSTNTNNRNIENNNNSVSNSNNGNRIYTRETNPINTNNNTIIKNSRTDLNVSATDASALPTPETKAEPNVDYKKIASVPDELKKDTKATADKTTTTHMSIKNSNFPNTNPLLQNN